MATTLTRNLKLKIDSDLTADAKFNLEKIDTLGSVYQTTTSGTARIRSQNNIQLEPNSSDIGGSGSGGTITFGSADHIIDSLVINSASVSFSSGIGLTDIADNTYRLDLKYNSTLSGIADTADRLLTLDVNGADRELTLGGNLSVLTSSLSLTVPADTSWTLPNPATETSGYVLTTDGTGLLSWTAATASSLAGLSDTTITSPSASQHLVFNGSAWVNESPAVQSSAVSWVNGDGNVKTIAHGFDTRNIIVQVIDNDVNYCTVEVDSVERIDNNQVQLTSANAPTGTWTVLLTTV